MKALKKWLIGKIIKDNVPLTKGSLPFEISETGLVRFGTLSKSGFYPESNIGWFYPDQQIIIAQAVVEACRKANNTNG